MNTEQLIGWIQERQLQYCHRQLLLIAGSMPWVNTQIDTILFNLKPDNKQISTLFVSDTSWPFDREVSKSTIAHYKQHLGKEFNVVIYNAFDGVKPSAVLALEGCVKKGGLFIILCPSLNEWPAHEAEKQGISFSFMERHQYSYFIERFVNFCEEDKNVAIHEEEQVKTRLTPPLAQLAKHNRKAEIALLNRLSEQQEAVREIVKQGYLRKDHCGQSKCMLISAKRGRGKSTLLGLSALDFYTQNSNTHIYITAPAKRNCERAISSFEKAKTSFNQTRSNVGSNIAEKNLEFVPYDQLSTLADDSILFIDEAASLAPKIVIDACKRFSHVLLASTNEGYEGSGLGFTLKVLPKLRSMTAHFDQIELVTPFRYYEGDCLENLFESIFVPRSAQCCTIIEEDVSTGEIDFTCKKGAELANNEVLLKQVFTELLQSHYQTSPDDLMRLLDSEDQFTVLAFKEHTNILLGVVSIVEEGNISKQCLSEDTLHSGRRRLKGHLVAQNLAMSFLESQFMRRPTWRIARIAVNPQYRARGIGSALLSHIKHLAQAEYLTDQPHALSTSFGYKPELYRFWTQNDYQFIKAGARKDTSSGERSLILIQPLTEKMTLATNNLHHLVLCSLSFLANVVQADDDFLDKLLRFTHASTSSKSKQSATLALQRIRTILSLYVQDKRPFSLCSEAIASMLFMHQEGSLLNSVFNNFNNYKNNQVFNCEPDNLSELESAFIKHNQRDVAKTEKDRLQRKMRELLSSLLQ